MHKSLKLTLIVPILLLVAACSSEPKQTQSVTTRTDSGASTAPPAQEVQRRNNALVRVINANPESSGFDIFVDDQKVFDSVSFKAVTPYKELAGDRHTFRLRRAGQDTSQPLVENSESLSSGKHYTVTVMPDTNDKMTLAVFADDLGTPPADKAVVRVINASPDVGEVDVVNKQKNDKIFSGVNSTHETRYVNLDPMKTTIEVRQEGQDKPVVSLSNANFEKGRYYTIVIAGHLKGAPGLETLMVQDEIGPAV